MVKLEAHLSDGVPLAVCEADLRPSLAHKRVRRLRAHAHLAHQVADHQRRAAPAPGLAVHVGHLPRCRLLCTCRTCRFLANDSTKALRPPVNLKQRDICPNRAEIKSGSKAPEQCQISCSGHRSPPAGRLLCMRHTPNPFTPRNKDLPHNP